MHNINDDSLDLHQGIADMHCLYADLRSINLRMFDKDAIAI